MHNLKYYDTNTWNHLIKCSVMWNFAHPSYNLNIFQVFLFQHANMHSWKGEVYSVARLVIWIIWLYYIWSLNIFSCYVHHKKDVVFSISKKLWPRVWICRVNMGKVYCACPDSVSQQIRILVTTFKAGTRYRSLHTRCTQSQQVITCCLWTYA